MRRSKVRRMAVADLGMAHPGDNHARFALGHLSPMTLDCDFRRAVEVPDNPGRMFNRTRRFPKGPDALEILGEGFERQFP
jgi:hypothetical protein